MMKRREFIQKSGIGAGIILGSGLSFSSLAGSWVPKSTDVCDLAVVKGGEPVEMFDLAIQMIGGLERFIARGTRQKVLIKPNISWDRRPELAATTNPELIGHLVTACYEAGAREVYVLDHTCQEWTKCYKNSGIERAAKDANAKIIPANQMMYYQDVVVQDKKGIKTTLKVHELAARVDLLINVPILKSHSSTQMSGALTNLMGLLWDRSVYHQKKLDRSIAEFLYFKIPEINIIDAYRVLAKNGPIGGNTADVELMKTLIVSTDIVAADAYAARMLGYEPNEIEYIRAAHEMGFGEIDMKQLNVCEEYLP